MAQSPRSISPKQILGFAALALALFFMFSFATKSVNAYRLRTWRDELQVELDRLERERQELKDELAYRQSPAYMDSALREAGMLPTDVIRVIPVTRIVVETPATPEPSPAPERSEPTIVQDRGAFRNPNWEAWKRLILGFDE